LSRDHLKEMCAATDKIASELFFSQEGKTEAAYQVYTLKV